MQQIRITFPNAQGIDLAAVLDLPDGGRPLAFALFAHCFTCTKNIAAAAHIALDLASRNIAVLRFDFTGLGESRGDFTASTFSQNVEDLTAAARYLERHYRPPQLLVGHSLGGTAVLHAARHIPSAEVLATIAAPRHPGHILGVLAGARETIQRRGRAEVTIAGRPVTLGKPFLDDLEDLERQAEPDLPSLALLVMHSPRDRVVAIDNAAEIFRGARHPKSFVSLDPADHLLSRRVDADFAAEMIWAWAHRHLARSSAPDKGNDA